jgi:hypothetical protein
MLIKCLSCIRKRISRAVKRKSFERKLMSDIAELYHIKKSPYDTRRLTNAERRKFYEQGRQEGIRKGIQEVVVKKLD